MKVIRAHFPPPQIVDFVGDLRLVEVSGEHGELAADMTGEMSLLDDMGVRYHTQEGKKWWPTRRISWLGFEVDTFLGVVKLEAREGEKGPRLRKKILEDRPGSEMPARSQLASASFLNFLHQVVPGGFCHLRSG